MSAPTRWSFGFLVVCLALPTAARAQKLDKDEKKWLDDVRPLMLPDEERTLRSLKDKADRQEFQKIFWARRDPDLDTPENEFEPEYRKALAQADTRFKVPGAPGSTTDCGRVFILLGPPDEVKKEMAETSLGGRYPEVWTYRDRPGQTFQGGQAQISFDAECRAPAVGLSSQLSRVAESKIAHPNIGYRMKDGHLVKLVDQLPKSTPARALLKTPRQDFPIATQVSFLKVQDGGTALLGLVRGEGAVVGVEEVGGKKVAKVVVAASAVGEDGKEAAFAEQKAYAELLADGSFVASYRMGLKPGKYTLQAGALDEKNGKGSLATISVEVPDLNTGELSMASLLIVRDVEELPEGTAEDPQHAFAAFVLGRKRLVPHFGNAFAKSDAPSFIYQVYDLKVDEATGMASGVATLSLLKGGKVVVAQAPNQNIETPIEGGQIGPVPLEKYDPGPYVVRLRVRDKLASKEQTQEIPLEIKP